MKISTSSGSPTLLTSDGEFLHPIDNSLLDRKPQAQLFVKVSRLLFLPLSAILLTFSLLFEPFWSSFFLSIFITISITAGIIRLWYIVPVRLWVYTHLIECIDRDSEKKEKYKNSSFSSQSGVEIRQSLTSPTELFLLSPRHKSFLTGNSSHLEKYGFDGDEHGVFEVVVPVFGCSSLIIIAMQWGLIQSLILYLLAGRNIFIGLVWIDVPLSIIAFGFMLFMLTYTVFVVFKAVDAELKFRYLQQYGELIFGRIVDISKGVNNRKKPEIVIHYRFLTPDGREISAVQHAPAKLIKTLPSTNMSVAVLLAPNGRYKLL